MQSIPAIGNDIVDLQDAESRELAGQAAFRCRVFTASEIRNIARAENPLQRLWAVWACKESAYKALKRKDPRIVFSPRRFITDKDLSAVRHGNLTVSCRVAQASDFVLALAVADGSLSKILSRSQCLLHNTDASSAARALLLSLLPGSVAQGALPTTVSPPGNPRAPVLYESDLVPATAISLSHHGRFVAAALYDAGLERAE